MLGLILDDVEKGESSPKDMDAANALYPRKFVISLSGTLVTYLINILMLLYEIAKLAVRGRPTIS